VNTLAEYIRDTLTSTAEEILGKAKKKKQPWITDDILELCDKRREMKKNKHANTDAADLYRQANNQVKKAMNKAKENWIEMQCTNIEEGIGKGNSKTAFQTLKKLTKNEQHKSSVIEDSNGNLLTESSAVLNRWTEYCTELYNYELKTEPSIINKQQYQKEPIENIPILQAEIEDAVKKLKTGKSPGVDNVPGELIKYGGNETIKALTTLCQKIWQLKEWPKEWTQSLVIPIPKKGNAKKCQNHRTISLISHPSKIMLRVMLNRLKNVTEELLAEEQAGFRAGKSTVEQIFNCRIIIIQKSI